MGLLANLSTAQIVEQVVEARRIVAAEGQGATLTNLVFMGMSLSSDTQATALLSEALFWRQQSVDKLSCNSPARHLLSPTATGFSI